MQRFPFLFFCLTVFFLSLNTHCTDGDDEILHFPTLDSIVSEKISYSFIEGETLYITVTFYPATVVENLTKDKIHIDIENPTIIEAEITDFSLAKASIKIIARKTGKTKIKVSVEDFEKTFEADIIVGLYIPITEIRLDNTELRIVKGKTATLTATISPDNTIEDKSIIWTSSNEGIATVDENGKITALSYGDATITATSKANTNISTTCKINVVSPEPQMTQLYFAKAINSEVSYTRTQSMDTFYGIIDEQAKTITLEFPYLATLSSLSNVKLHFSLTEGAKVHVATVEQKSGETAVDFSHGSADYILTAEDGTTTKTYKLIIDHRTYAYIPDENFRTFLKDTYDMKGDSLNTKHSSVVNEDNIDIGNKSIQDLTGIEFFTALTSLSCNNNDLTLLDISKNIALTNLWCNNNALTELDINKNVALIGLYCDNNQLTSLNLRTTLALTTLWCNSNQLTQLDISKNVALTLVKCDKNQLIQLDISKNTTLTDLDCASNSLTGLDISKNTALTTFNCASNSLTGLDISKNTALTTFNCASNSLTGLDISKNTALTTFNCASNSLTGLDISKNTALTTFNCASNALTGLDISKNTALTTFNCNNNKLKTLDMRGMRTVTNLNINASNTNLLDTLKVHLNLQTIGAIKEVKNRRGANVKIQTYSADAGSTSYTAVCCDYDPNAGTCTTQATDGSCP